MSARPLVGVDGRALLEPPGGLRRYAESVVPLLPEAAPEFSWLGYVTAPPGSMPALDGIRWRYLAGSLQALRRPWWEDIVLPRALRQDGVAVLLSPYGAVPRVGPPVVAVVHDVVALCHPETLRWHHRWYWRRVARRLPRAARVVANSAATAAEVCHRAGVTPERVVVAPLAPSPAFRPVDPAAVAEVGARLRLQLPYVVVVAGAGGVRKGLATLAAAAAGIEGLELVVVGATTAPAGPRLHQPGWLPDDQLAALMSGAVAVACPSITEGFGLPVVEAMACGAAVIASRAGALTEVAGEAALLVAPGDVGAWREGLQRLLVDPQLRLRLGQAGRERVRKLSWSRCAAITVDAVREVLGGEGRP
jgi:glycosyltransferase involved in cell wall biosynthesis